MVHVGKLLVNDARNIVRDRLLVYTAFLIPFIIIIITLITIIYKYFRSCC